MIVAHPPRNGFTLIELLAAMLAGALLLAWLGWSVGAVAERARQHPVMTPEAQLAEAWPWLLAHIEGAHFDDQDRTQRLLVPAPLSLGTALPVWFDPGVIPLAAGGKALVVNYRDPASGAALAPPIELANGFADLSIEQRIVVGDPRRAAWHVRAVSKDGAVYELVARPQITAKGGCLFDPISLACRP